VEPNQPGSDPENSPKSNPHEQKPQDVAQRLADEFTQLENDADAPGGSRARRLRHLDGSYRLAFHYHEHLDEYQKLQALPYFEGMYQRENSESIMRIVLTFTMQAKGNDVRLNRVSKSAAVFDSFYAEGVNPDAFATILKERRGVDFIYDQLLASKRIRREVIAVEDEADGLDASVAEPLPAETNDGTAEVETSDAAEDAADSGIAGDSIALGAISQSDDEASRQLAAMARTANQHSNALSGQDQEAERPPRRPLSRADREVYVAFKMRVLDLLCCGQPGRAIIYTEFGLPEKDDWTEFPVVRIVNLKTADEPWPILTPPAVHYKNKNHNASQPTRVGNDEVAMESSGPIMPPSDSAPEAAQPASPLAPTTAQAAATGTSRPTAAAQNTAPGSATAVPVSKASSGVPLSVGPVPAPKRGSNGRAASKGPRRTLVEAAKSR
jgi:hypothetical protein